MRTPPTPTQQRCLDALQAFIARKGYPPSLTELGDALGCGFHNARRLLVELEAKGWIRREPGRVRGVEVLT